MVKNKFSDEELTAFLDGEVDGEVSRAIMERVAVDEDLAHRLEGLSFPVDQLRDEANQLLTKAPEFVEPQRSSVGRLTAGMMRYAAVLVAGLAVGFLANSLLRDAEPEGWVQAVASYQALYVEETLGNANQPAAIADNVLKTFGERQDVPVLEMKDLPALSFKRAQILGYQSAPLLQMAFTDAKGVPVALCVTLVEEPDRPPSKGTYSGLPAYDWVLNGRGYILIGDMNASEMKSVVTRIESILG